MFYFSWVIFHRYLDHEFTVIQVDIDVGIERLKKGLRYLEETESEKVSEYEDLSHSELVQKFRGLEEKVDQLEEALEAFRRQILKKLEESEKP